MLCSFCGKTNEEAKVLIVGPEANICDECIKECDKIILVKRMEEVQRIIYRVAFREFWGTD